ncbi:hypothetical protein N7522_004882 [Penicillium canescens]|uniref:uncharacterized protein n=1 Tax=Penicillium canescens TaxID=5083 RepID=UPI0026DFA190|nr:uncharacterized protein N7446_004759 [Penicillium canescens]KAJ6009866.1 hypothetical protein N7522_004882 [Penicillium canescens]KAJ6067722.1 hypothetical protein N7446_004759 [Penicillium canescens]
MTHSLIPSFVDTPGEIILGVAEHLSLMDLNSLVQLAQRFHELLSKQLYSRAATFIRSDGKTPLIWAAERGRVRSMQKLLDQDPDPAKLINGKGAVHYAATEGHEEAVELLLKAGVPVSMPDEILRTPLNLATLQNHEHVVRFLLASGAGHTARPADNDWEWGGALTDSVMEEFESVARALLEAGKRAPPEHANDVKQWIYAQLCLAASYGKCNMMKLLLEFDGATHLPEVEYQPPVHLAAAGGHMDALQLLLDHGADISVVDVEGDTIMHHAAVGGDEEILRFLMDRDMDVDVPGGFGNTPLMNAVVYNRQTAAQMLLDAGANATEPFSNGDPPINFAAHFGSKEMAKLLQDGGASINDLGRGNRSALHEAALGDNTAIIPFLCRAGVPMDALDVNELSALHLAAVHGHTEFVRKLLDMGMNASVGEPGGRMPIHAAAVGGHPDVLQLLIDAGADPCAVHKEGDHTALHYAAMYGNTEVVQVLLQAFQEQTVKTLQSLQPCHCGRSPLKKAAANGNTEIIKLMKDNGVDVTLYHEGSSALHLATSAGQAEVAGFLMSLGADAFRLDIYGRSSLDWASLDPPTLEALLKYCPQPPPTDRVKRTSALREGIFWLASRALVEGYKHHYRLGKCLLYIDDLPSARISFILDAQPPGDDAIHYSPAVCDSCSDSLTDSRFVCRTCPDVDFCSECINKYQEQGGKIKLCEGHEFLEIRVSDRELLEEPANEFRDRWLQGLVAAYGNSSA